jgi:membrane protease YdiL (CAAX protease family)
MDSKPNYAKALATQYPLLFALVFFVISFCLNCGMVIIGQHVVAIAYIGVLAAIIQSFLALGVLAWLGWLQVAGFNTPSHWHNLYLLWLPALLALFYLTSTVTTSVSSVTVVIFAVIFALLTGLNEEACFRGVILQTLLPYGPRKAALLSGLFFSLAHFTNLFTHLPSIIILGQVIGGFLLGFGFAACRLRTKTIWPLIIFHALFDLPANVTLLDKSTTTVYSLLYSLSSITVLFGLITPGIILTGYALFLLRSRRLPLSN